MIHVYEHDISANCSVLLNGHPLRSLVFSVVRHAPSAMLLFSIFKVVGLLDINSLPGRLLLPSISTIISNLSSLLAYKVEAAMS